MPLGNEYMGVDNVSVNVAAAVPELPTWPLMLMELAAVGVAKGRRGVRV